MTTQGSVGDRDDHALVEWDPTGRVPPEPASDVGAIPMTAAVAVGSAGFLVFIIDEAITVVTEHRRQLVR